MRWNNLFRRKHWDQERARELDAYLEIETQENVTRGMPLEEARNAARRKLGNSTLIREEIYHMNSIAILESLWQDIRYSLRALRKSPAFTMVVVASLALGIGANTAIFTLINAALLKMLPVQNPEQLVEFKSISPAVGLNDAFSYPIFTQFRGQTRVLSGVLAFRGLYNVDFEVNGHGGLAYGQVVSGDYFSVLGVKAILGRTITLDDEQARNPVAVIGYDYWRTRFALDPEVIGMKILLNNSPFTVIGVTPPEFFGVETGARIDVSVPLPLIAQLIPGFAAIGTPFEIMTSGLRNWLYVMGRLKPGVTKEQAAAYLEPIFERSMRSAVDNIGGLPFGSLPIRQEFLAMRLHLDTGGQGLATLRRQFSKPLLIVMAVVALLLLVTCANVANLLLARGNARHREIAVRLAIGAGRSRLIRQLIAESILLAIGGGALGLFLAFWAGRSLLLLMAHSRSPVLLDVHPDTTVLAFTLLISVFTALLFGIVPAWRAARLDLSPASLQTTRSPGQSGGRSRLGKALVIVQVAVSLVLTIGAGLLTRSLANLKDFYPGFNKSNVLLLTMNPLMTGYPEDQLVPLFERLLDRFTAIPGVRSATFSVHGLLNPNVSTSPIRVEGRKIEARTELASMGVEPVGPNYFKTLETPVLLGRDFAAEDRVGAVKVAAINQTAARFFFGDSNPIGRRISMPGYRGDPSWLEIIGVVQDAKYHSLREQSLPMVYISQLQYPESFVTFEIRTAVNPANATTAVTNAVKATDPRLPVFDVKTLSDQLDDSLVQERLVASLSSAFGSLALLLAGVGLYGLMAFAVNRRTNEIGIRMALGAKPVQISRMVLRETLLLVSLGLAIGIPVAIAVSKLIATELFGLKTSDPITLLLASLVTAGIAALAGFLPARRASRVDPITALRYE
jgi:predicted permease